MLKFLSFLLSVLSVVLSVKHFLAGDSLVGPVAYAHYAAFALSFGILVLLTERKAPESKFALPGEGGGELRIGKKVFETLADGVLEGRSELKEYRVELAEQKGQLAFKVCAQPNLEQAFSFKEFAESASEAIKAAVREHTSFEVAKVDFEFLSAEKKKKAERQ